MSENCRTDLHICMYYIVVFEKATGCAVTYFADFKGDKIMQVKQMGFSQRSGSLTLQLNFSYVLIKKQDTISPHNKASPIMNQ